MSNNKLAYFRTTQDVPTRGEAVSIYECQLLDGDKIVKRCVTYIEDSGDYDRMQVSWAMKLCKDDIQQVDEDDFLELWELEVPEE